MNKKNKRGTSGLGSGGLKHAVVSTLGVGAITLGSILSSGAEARATRSGHISMHPRARTRTTRLGYVPTQPRAEARKVGARVVHVPVPFYFIGGWGNGNITPLSSRPKYHPALAGDTRFGWPHSGYLDPDIVYDMSVAGRIGPDGIPHTGYVSREIFSMPSTLKSRIVPYDSGRNDIARRYSDARATSLAQRVQDRTEELSDKEKLERYKAAVEERKKRVKQVREAEGLNEPALFRQYFDSIGEDYSMAHMSVSSQTVALYITLKNHPGLVIEWHDPTLMESMLKHEGRAGFCESYKDSLDEFRSKGINVIEITEKEPDRIISKLEDIATKLKLSQVNPDVLLSRIQESQPYILGPNYSEPKR